VSMYNFNHLYYFYMTVKSDGVTSASHHLQISQPSLSSQLKVLEEFLQVKLFIKVGRKNRLTTEGTVVYGYCRKMFELSEEMHDILTQKTHLAARKIYIGVSHEIANSFIVEVVSHFLNSFKGIIRPTVYLVKGDHEKLTNQLKFRELDILVTQHSLIDPELNHLSKVEIPVHLIYFCKKKSGSKDIFATIESHLKDMLGNELPCWVLPPAGFKLRSEINNFIDSKSLKGRTVFESDVIESLTRSILDEVGMSFLPKIYLSDELKQKKLKTFGPDDGLWQHRLWLSCHTASKTDPLIEAMSSSFNEICSPATAN